jgi:hypothetical protein
MYYYNGRSERDRLYRLKARAELVEQSFSRLQQARSCSYGFSKLYYVDIYEIGPFQIYGGKLVSMTFS